MAHEPASDPSTAHPSGSEHPVLPPGHDPVTQTPATGDNHGTWMHDSGALHSSPVTEQPHVGRSEVHFAANPHHFDLVNVPFLPAPPAQSHTQSSRPGTVQGGSSAIGLPTAAQYSSDVDWIAPHDTLSGQNQEGQDKTREDHVSRVEFLGELDSSPWLGCMPWKRRKGVVKIIERNPGDPESLQGTSNEMDGSAWLGSMLCKRKKKSVKIIETRQWSSGTMGYRIAPTIRCAQEEREKCAESAQLKSWAINLAIGLQVLLGALTTALAAAVTSAKQAQISTAVLGGLATLVASYLARVRGSGEPELSVLRVKDLDHFIRDCRIFELDHGHKGASGHRDRHLEKQLTDLRQKFEDLLGNGDGKRKLSETGVGPHGQETGSTTASPAADTTGVPHR